MGRAHGTEGKQNCLPEIYDDQGFLEPYKNKIKVETISDFRNFGFSSDTICSVILPRKKDFFNFPFKGSIFHNLKELEFREIDGLMYPLKSGSYDYKTTASDVYNIYERKREMEFSRTKGYSEKLGCLPRYDSIRDFTVLFSNNTKNNQILMCRTMIQQGLDPDKIFTINSDGRPLN